ncbi:N-acetyltransferase [Cryobacterium sp. TMT4-10]|nr:N-acetyltransferase [Cryobacterium sp. TMT4-10]
MGPPPRAERRPRRRGRQRHAGARLRPRRPASPPLAVEPVDLSSPLLRLDQPTPADAETIFAYCQDPLFEKYLTVPWPYTRAHADSFIAEYVPGGWASDLEYTWAVRAADAPELLGVIGFRVPDASLGYWLGAPHRGRGLIPEAQRLVIDWVFANGIVSTINWQCLVGNMPSSRTAWRAGFTFTGEAPAVQVHRDGTYPPAWHGRLRATDDRAPKPGWPAGVAG